MGHTLIAHERRRPGAAMRDLGVIVLEAAGPLLGAAVEVLGGAGLPSLALPLRHPVALAALLLDGIVSTRKPNPHEPTMLWGVVELAMALQQLAPELERRLATSRYSASNAARSSRSSAPRAWVAPWCYRLQTKRHSLCIVETRSRFLAGKHHLDSRFDCAIMLIVSNITNGPRSAHRVWLLVMLRRPVADRSG